MHISDGVLSAQVIATGFAIAGVGVAVGLRKLNTDKIVRVAFFASVFFLASLVNVKIPPSSAHLSMLAPIGLVLGWGSFPAMFMALALQAVLLQFGGLLALGVNTTNVAIPALLSYLLCAKAIRGSQGTLYGVSFASVLGFLAGFGAVFLCASLVALSLYLSDHSMKDVGYFVFISQMPLAIIEGIVTFFMVGFLKKTAPDILSGIER